MSLAIGIQVIVVYAAPLRLFLRPFTELPDIPGGLNTQTLMLTMFSIAHALYVLGWRNTLVFFTLSAVISWAFEQAGVTAGVIYGSYHYTDELGLKVGAVPLLIPLAWFMMIYPSYVIANLIVDAKPTGSQGGFRHLIALAAVSAIVVTAWDLLIDPVLSNLPRPMWVWEQGGPYFGVPIQNYVGWLLTTFTIYLTYRLYERRFKPQPTIPVTTTVAAMPLVAYGLMMLGTMTAGGPNALMVIGPIVMGIPLLLAARQLRNHHQRMM
ncbi:MAG: carotenoid biosynthesis protein [Anaerolineae bacterium]|nr:carotenoid biosynthesis protein [Anaerolineae bacterium]